MLMNGPVYVCIVERTVPVHFSYAIISLFHVALSSCGTLFMLHFVPGTLTLLHILCGALVSCCFLSILNIFHFVLFSCCTLPRLHFLHVMLSHAALFSIYTIFTLLFFMLHFFDVAHFSQNAFFLL